MANSLTHNGAVQYDHTLDHAVEFFSKAGSIYTSKNRKSYYTESSNIIDMYKNVWASGDKITAMKLLFYIRDPRGGAGNRSGFRDCVKWLIDTEAEWVNANIGLIPEHGRWDDVRILFDTYLDESAAKFWANAILEKNVLAAKWADRNDKSILRYLRKTNVLKDVGEFRRLLAKIRKEHIVEHKMCSNNWKEIKYPTVPSVAMSRYSKAFNTHDAIGFEKFKEKVANGEVKINASTVFPHDLVRIAKNGDTQIADLQFAAMPNYLEDTAQRIMVLVDSSGSMDSDIGGSIRAIDVSTSLGLYCSDRLGKENPFYRKFMEFQSESKLTDWSNKTFSECYVAGGSCLGHGIFNEACGHTNIKHALDSILKYAKMFNATNEQIPNTLLIISDMQFDATPCDNAPVVEQCMSDWENAGYSRPKIVYWNVSPYTGSPALASHKDVGLVSGFSPAILTAIFNAKDFSPRGIMNEAIKKYNVVSPN